VQAIKQELGLIKEDVQDCIDSKVRPNLTDVERLDLLKENVKFKRRIQEVNRKLVVVNNRLIQIDSSYRYKKENGPKIKYKAMKGDVVDVLIADYINNNDCPVPLQRLGNGYYMFGSKKIFAKIINGKLVIRVGGGYMGIDEFI